MTELDLASADPRRPGLPDRGNHLQGRDAADRRPGRVPRDDRPARGVGRARGRPIVILGAEARGFIFGGALAYALGCGFVTARKPGKLPWETIEARYALEYGTDALEVHVDAIAARRPA